MTVKDFKVYHCVLQIIQPPYSPDLAPIKTFVFLQVETLGRHGRQGKCNHRITFISCRRLSWRLCVTSRKAQKVCCRQERLVWRWGGGGKQTLFLYDKTTNAHYFNACTVHLCLWNWGVSSRDVCTLKGGEGQSNTTVVIFEHIMWY